MTAHITVLLNETVDALNVTPDGCYVDCTFGRGGHTALLLSGLGDKGRLIAFDRDPQAIEAGKQRFADDSRIDWVEQGFDALASVVGRDSVDGVMADLGVSSPQLDQAERGFSFLHDGPLDMRMDPTSGQSAAQWLASVAHPDLARVLRVYGDERHASRLATAIIEARKAQPFERTGQLAECIKAAHPSWPQGRHPATQAFQAIRIFINDELGHLERVLPQMVDVLKPGGRLAVISFHSLEDRMVKRFIRDEANPKGDPLGLLPSPAPRLKAIGKAIYPSQAEVDANPRSRSAVLRIAEKVAALGSHSVTSRRK